MNETPGQIEVGNSLAELPQIYAFINAASEVHGLSDHLRRHLTLIIEELFSNAVSYGYPEDRTDRIRIAIRPARDVVTVDFSDGAEPFDTSIATEPEILSETPEEMKVGGLGLFLVHQIAASVTYRREAERNCTTVVLSRSEGPDD